MKRVLLAISMVALILGVSYIKVELDDREMDRMRREAARAAAERGRTLEESLDSVQLELKQARAAFGDSVRLLRENQARQTDSLRSMIAGQQAGVEAESGPASSAKPALVKEVKVPQPDSVDFHRKVLAYYKRRYLSLPADLSRYERRVALSEIRQETAKRFAITVDDLNGIRRKSNLDY